MTLILSVNKFFYWKSSLAVFAGACIVFGMLCNTVFANTNLPGNHIHNFSHNLWDRTSPDWALPALHARELGYRLVTIGKPKDFNFESLQVIKLSDAYFLPVRINIKNKTVLYLNWLANDKATSLLRDNRLTYKWYEFDNSDLQIIDTYGCRQNIDVKMEGAIDLQKIKQAFYTGGDSRQETIVAYNFHSKFAVRKLVENTLRSYSLGDYAALFFDDLAREIPNCQNKYVGGEGSYQTWREGQKDFLVKVSAELKKNYPDRDLIFGNVWHPLAQRIIQTHLKWFADASLKFDHYYLEAGPNKVLSIAANGSDPLTGLPAYVVSDGYLPADRVSISTSYGWYGSQNNDEQRAGYKSGYKEYLEQHYYVARIAALQGSWFGWYGESNVDTRELNSGVELGRLVHTNDMQLLRAIPGWDNLAQLILADRRYDHISQSYRSSNSYFSPSIIYSRHFKSGEMFAVFKKKSGEIKLLPNEIISEAWFSNHYFKRTGESALSCLKQDETRVLLTCESALDRGIRITLELVNPKKLP